MSGWIGVDFDGTLAEYHGWRQDQGLGEPVPKMLERVKAWLVKGQEVRIFTARVGNTGLRNEDGVLDGESFSDNQRRMIEEWCLKHLGTKLEVTATKDLKMIELWDDRAVQVKMNTGEPVGYSTRGL